MTSKLFYAVVGAGIALGCGATHSDDHPKTTQTPEAGPVEGGLPAPDAGVAEVGAGDSSFDAVSEGTVAPDSAAADAAPDVSVDAAPDASADAAPDASADAAPDGPKDAIADAFCDATWPITKSGREVCGPADSCIGSEAPWCWGSDGQGSCRLYPLKCVGGSWLCLAGAPTNTPFQPGKCP